MQCGHAMPRLALVVAVGLIMAGTASLADAQQRVDTRVLSMHSGDNSRIGGMIEEVADNDGVAEGAMVNEVRPDSPAESAGIEDGDVIVRFDGERVRSARQLSRLVQETPAGRTVSATLIRNGSQMDVEVQELSSQLADYFGVESGVLVTEVQEGSVAAEAGVQTGDMITSVDGRGIDDVRALRRLSGFEDEETVPLGITRGGQELELSATLEGPERPRWRRGGPGREGI